MNTAISADAGTSSPSNWSRLLSKPVVRICTPVKLPLGRLRVATRPSLTGSAPLVKRSVSFWLPPSLPALRAEQRRRSRPPDGQPTQPPTPPAERTAHRRINIPCRRSGRGDKRFLQARAERPPPGAPRHLMNRFEGNQSLAISAAARAPQAARLPPRR